MQDIIKRTQQMTGGSSSERREEAVEGAEEARKRQITWYVDARCGSEVW
jgi:hypothetical protein